jgi:hypothetical protein
MFRFLATAFAASILTGCGVGMPPPTQKPVALSDVAGEWQYGGMYPGDRARITFDTNGTFVLIMRYDSGAAFTNRGTWALSGADLELTPFWTTAIGGTPKRLEQHERSRWWITDWYTKSLAPFGGDSLDPDQWTLLGRVQR